jgi:predicted nucleic acid-binding protein
MASARPQTSSPAGAIIVDANVAIAISSKETGRDVKAAAELQNYAAQDYLFYAPGVLISETLYILCLKVQAGVITATEYAQAIVDLNRLMKDILPPPSGDAALISRAAAIGSGYGCSRSADSLYIALAEELAATTSTILLTFDADLPKQAAKNAPSVTVQLLTI